MLLIRLESLVSDNNDAASNIGRSPAIIDTSRREKEDSSTLSISFLFAVRKMNRKRKLSEEVVREPDQVFSDQLLPSLEANDDEYEDEEEEARQMAAAIAESLQTKAQKEQQIKVRKTTYDRLLRRLFVQCRTLADQCLQMAAREVLLRMRLCLDFDQEIPNTLLLEVEDLVNQHGWSIGREQLFYN